jgi:hypothetical protein
VVKDVSIGALLHIDAIRAVDHIQLQPGRQPVNHPSISVAGVTFAGQRASVDDQGVHVAGSDGPSATQRLAGQGISVRTVGIHRHATAAAARSDATALAVDVEIPVDGVPYVPNPLPPLPPPFDQVPQLPGVNANGLYVAHISLGAVGAVAGGGRQPTFDLGGVGPVGDQPTNGTGPGTGATGPLGGRDLVNGLGSPSQQPPPAVAGPPATLARQLTDLLSRRQLEVLYAVLALGTLGLFMSWRGAVSLHRRPRSLLGLRDGRP